jgi:DNA-binding transcriptional ArsR family regulator
METRLDLLLHPVRIRILMTVAGRHLTPTQIAVMIPDVPQTTLYRHINILVEGHILAVMAEKQVRGTVERSYGLVENAGLLDRTEIGNRSNEDHMRYFMIFLSTLLQDFTKYLDTLEASPGEMLYSKVPLYLTKVEQQDLILQIRLLLLPYMAEAENDSSNEPRQRFMFASIAIPDKDPKSEKSGDTQ